MKKLRELNDEEIERSEEGIKRRAVEDIERQTLFEPENMTNS